MCPDYAAIILMLFFTQLLQMMPWYAGLCHKDDDSLIIQVLREIITSLSSKKQEEQYLKLIEELTQVLM